MQCEILEAFPVFHEFLDIKKCCLSIYDAAEICFNAFSSSSLSPRHCRPMLVQFEHERNFQVEDFKNITMNELSEEIKY